MKRTFLLFLIVLFPEHLICQQDQVFALQNNTGIGIVIDTTITDNTLLEPFKSQMIISGLVFSGEIVFHSDSSLVRIVLMDDSYNEYLIYEAYPVLSGSRQFSVIESGEETNLLNSITPAHVSIEIVHASVHLKEFIISQEDTYQATTKGAILLQQNESKIHRINQNIQNSGQTWVAGETALSKLSYQEKKSMFGGSIPNFQGFEYYTGGIFVIPGALTNGPVSKQAHSENNSAVNSIYPSEFSWQNRHGADWLTPVKDQTVCNSCYVHGNTAATELMVNLYYNRHLDYDLSEQHIISCSEGTCEEGGSPKVSLDFIINEGVVLEDCFPYSASDQDCADICDDPSERIKITDWEILVNQEDMKGEIISGATSGRIDLWRHHMQIVGYKVLESGDSLFVRGYDSASYVMLEQGNQLIGETAWLCKNSWGESWGNQGYGYFIVDKGGLGLHSLRGPVNSMIYDDSDILCTDQDGDGFYFWGIGPKPSYCPDSPDNPDDDDSDPCVGAMDEFGNLQPTTPTPVATDSIILLDSSPDLYVNGSNLRWYNDKGLQTLVHEGELFPTGHSEPGKYTYYVTQTISGCVSAADDISLSVLLEIPRPIGHDTVLNIKEATVIKVEGEPGAEFKWYEDPLLTILLDTGESYEAVKTDTGTYRYYVTQVLCTLESAPDTVMLTISNYVNIPDAAFLNALFDEGVDTNVDNLISNEEAEAIKSLDVSNKGIIDIKGIELFVNLDTLRCHGNRFSDLDISKITNIVYLDCHQNMLTSLDCSNNSALVELQCWDNELSSLDISKCKVLEVINCSVPYYAEGLLSNLDVSNIASLRELSCSNQQLTNLDVSKNTALTYLECGGNQITSMNVSKNTVLTYLDCGGNQLTSLDVSKNTKLEYLDCGGNQLTSMDVSDCIVLRSLRCSHNHLTSLDVSDCIALVKLLSDNNQLTSLDVSTNTSLSYIGISNNPNLNVVCVWTIPFSPKRAVVNRLGSPNVEFTDCSVGSEENKLIIYPNPLYDQLTIEIEYSDHCSVEITSLNGIMIYTGEMKGTSQQLDLSSFRKGVYFITIRSTHFVSTRKIIKL